MLECVRGVLEQNKQKTAREHAVNWIQIKDDKINQRIMNAYALFVLYVTQVTFVSFPTHILVFKKDIIKTA